MLYGPVGGALRAPPSGPQPHLLLTLAHYSYFFHDPTVATAGISLLRYIAGAVARANSKIRSVKMYTFYTIKFKQYVPEIY